MFFLQPRPPMPILPSWILVKFARPRLLLICISTWIEIIESSTWLQRVWCTHLVLKTWGYWWIKEQLMTISSFNWAAFLMAQHLMHPSKSSLRIVRLSRSVFHFLSFYNLCIHLSTFPWQSNIVLTVLIALYYIIISLQKMEWRQNFKLSKLLSQNSQPWRECRSSMTPLWRLSYLFIAVLHCNHTSPPSWVRLLVLCTSTTSFQRRIALPKFILCGQMKCIGSNNRSRSPVLRRLTILCYVFSWVLYLRCIWILSRWLQHRSKETPLSTMAVLDVATDVFENAGESRRPIQRGASSPSVGSTYLSFFLNKCIFPRELLQMMQNLCYVSGGYRAGKIGQKNVYENSKYIA